MIAVDLFAGFGGFTEGAERAGVHVAWAANHWPVAEVARGQGFPESYVWPGVGRGDALIGFGNAVPPELGRAVVGALVEALNG